MNTIFKKLILCIAILLLSACATLPQTPVEGIPTIVPVKPSSVPLLSPTPLSPSPTPEPLPTISLPDSDRVIFTIPNPEPWSGKEGDLRPDWKGWGAETFAVAPDGAFWIADTAVYPNRLLHYSPQGELLQEISLQDIVAYAFDLLATQQGIWVLDVSAEQPRVVLLDSDGELLNSADIPAALMTQDGMFVDNGAFGLLAGEDGALLLATINGYYELVDASGEIVAWPLEAISYAGHTFQEGPYDPASGLISVYLDGLPLESAANFNLNQPFLGFNPDGSFALAGVVQSPDGQADNQVKYFDAAGGLLGSARQRTQNFYKDWNHHLAFAPNGAVYQLLSEPDHSVQVLHLGFVEGLPPRVEPPLIPVPLTPYVPLSPAEQATTAEQEARNALIEFFANLNTGNFAAAAPHFGGQIEGFACQPSPGESQDACWAQLCEVLWCLPVAEITTVQQVSADEFIFDTTFMHPNGARFEIGACCGGDPASSPPIWQFAYPVKKIDGVWKVMRPPEFTP